MTVLAYLKSLLNKLKSKLPKIKFYILGGLLLLGYWAYRSKLTKAKIVLPEPFEVPINRFFRAVSGEMISLVLMKGSNLFFLPTKSQIRYVTNISMIPKTAIFKKLL